MQSQKTKKFFTFTSRISSAVLICNTEKEEPGLCVLMSLLVTPALAPEPQALELIWDHPFPFQGLRKSCPPWHTPSRLPAPLKKDRKSVRVCEECTCYHSQVITCFHLPPAAACCRSPRSRGRIWGPDKWLWCRESQGEQPAPGSLQSRDARAATSSLLFAPGPLLLLGTVSLSSLPSSGFWVLWIM